jgi:hypothetical protein
MEIMKVRQHLVEVGIILNFKNWVQMCEQD